MNDLLVCVHFGAVEPFAMQLLIRASLVEISVKENFPMSRHIDATQPL